MTAMPRPESQLLTAEDFLGLPKEESKRHELVEGRLVPVCAAASRSAIVATNISTSMNSFIREHRLGICGGADWSFRLRTNPDTVRMPDVAFVRADRIPPGGVPSTAWDGAPDLAVEVLSPSNRFSEIMERVQDFFDAGTRLMWVIDPDKRNARIFAPDRAMRIAGEDGMLDGEDVLPGFTLPLAQIWV